MYEFFNNIGQGAVDLITTHGFTALGAFIVVIASLIAINFTGAIIQSFAE